MSVDLKNEKGKEVFCRLAKEADILIEGYRPGAMDKLGLGYDALAKLNRRLIFCSISAYGSKGPWANLPGTELDVQAMMGNFRQLGAPGHPPMRVGYDLISSNAAWSAAQGIMAALYTREDTGEGQRVETSLLDAGIVILSWISAAESSPDEWEGNPLSSYNDPPDYGFQCKDASFTLDIGRDEEAWKTFCLAIGAQHLDGDPRFDHFRKRMNNVELNDALNPVFANWSFNDLRELVQGMGGTIVPMHNFESLVKNPQVEALEMIREMHHPVVGKYKTLDIPWHFSEPIAQLADVPAPLLGQHTKEILADIGYSASEIQGLVRQGVV